MHRFFCRVLLFQFLQILTHSVMDLGRFHQLFPWNPTSFGSVRLYEAAIHRQMFPLYQSHFHTLLHDLFKQLLEQLRFLKPSMPVFRKRRVMRNLLIKAETGEPAPRQMHAQFLHQFAFAGDAVQITDQQNAQQQLGVNRGAAGLAVAVFQLLPYKPAEGGLEPVPVDRFRGAYPHQLSSYALLSLSAFRARGARLSATLPLPDYGRVARNSEVIRGPVAKGMISKGVADV